MEPLFTCPVCSDGSDDCYYLLWARRISPRFTTCRRSGRQDTDGTGQTIAVVGETDINPQDVADFRNMFGLPANPPNII